MTARTVQGTVEFPVGSGSPCVGARIVASLYTGPDGAAAYGTANDIAVGSTAALSDNDGEWALALEPNVNISPAGTVWRIVITPPDRAATTVHATVPDTVGPHDLTDILTGEPGVLPSEALVAHIAEVGAHSSQRHVVVDAREFGDLDDDEDDHTAILQEAIDYCCGEGDPAAVFREAIAALRLPPGLLNLTSELTVLSVMGFRMYGDGFATRFKPSHTSGYALRFNGISSSRVGGFRVEGDETTEALDAAIHYHWQSAEALRSSTGNVFHDITIWNTKCKAAIAINDDDVGSDQVDVTRWVNLNLNGNWYANKAEGTYWQHGIKFPTAFGNVVSHSFERLAVTSYAKGIRIGPCDTTIRGVSFGHNGSDLHAEGVTTFSIEGVRSEHSERALTNTGAGSTWMQLSARNWLFTGNDVPADGRVIDWAHPGSLIVENFKVTTDPSFNLPKMRLAGQAPQLVKLSQVSTGSPLSSFLETVPSGTTVTVDGYVVENPATGSTSGQTPVFGVTATSAGQITRMATVDARYYGVKSDGTTNDTVAIQAAVDATPVGGTCVFPIGTGAMRIAAPINLREQRTYVFPIAGRMWPYRYTNPIAGSVKLTAAFSGAAGFLIQGNEITLRASDNDGVRIIGLVVDCGASSGNVHGIQVEGLCRDISLVDCAVIDAVGTGNGFDFRTGTGEAPPRGVRMQNCAAYSCASNGFRFNGVTDSNLSDLLATSNVARGFYLSNSGENSLVSCRAVFNGTDGFFFDGTTTVGMTTLLGPGTDRNGQNGILISQSGTQPIQIVAPRLRRDGSTSTSSNYAGLRLSGSAGLEVVPVDVTIPQVEPGINDDDTGDETPQFAVRALRAQRLTIHGGDLWGVSGGLSNAGNNTIVEWTPSTYWAAGAVGAKAREYPTPVGQSFIDMVEQADPAAPAANTARLYAKDNGSGKTQLMVRFPTGAVQQVAIEP